MSKGKIYIAGAMTGIKDYNFPAFDRAKDHLNVLGWNAVSPADMDREVGIEPDADGKIIDFDYRAAMRRCVNAVCDCGAIYMLSGWENSKGARAEHALANAIGLRVIYE